MQLLIDKKPKASRELPGVLGMFAAGNTIGLVELVLGIGGGSLSVPFTIWCNVAVRHAIGTSAAIGLPIAMAGTAGYVFNGWGVSELPDYSIGYVYLPALFCIAAISVLTAPIGARLAHSLPVGLLKEKSSPCSASSSHQRCSSPCCNKPRLRSAGGAFVMTGKMAPGTIWSVFPPDISRGSTRQPAHHGQSVIYHTFKYLNSKAAQESGLYRLASGEHCQLKKQWLRVYKLHLTDFLIAQ